MSEALITCDPKVMLGKPCIAGTRISVELILEELAAGRTEADLLAAYPRLTLEGIRAALRYALSAVRLEEFHPLSTSNAA
jgi:uncharacterized protein (DUF433 family)